MNAIRLSVCFLSFDDAKKVYLPTFNVITNSQVTNLRNPGHSDHRFRRIPTTDSGAFRPLIPMHSDHLCLVFSRAR